MSDHHLDGLARAYEGVAALYEAGRPTYPSEAVDLLEHELEIGPGRVVVDLGAGTGKFTRLLVPTGATVIAVEPIEAMRAELERSVPGAELRAGSAAELPFGNASVDVLTAAQAFHWFGRQDDVAEIARVLRPEGGLGLIWNHRDRTLPVWAEIETLIGPRRPARDRARWRRALASAGFAPLHETSFVFEHEATPEQITMRVASMSWIAALPDGEREPLLAAVEDIARSCVVDDAVAVRENTEVVWARRVG